MVLAGEVVIAEFLAESINGLLDEDDDPVDWIELYNGSGAVQALDGWHVTNDAAELDKWAIPAGVSLAPGEFLVIFASGKDRGDPAALHTNFQIDAAGGYVALVRPDGATVEHAYAPYPAQLADVSYGIHTPEPADPIATLAPTHDLWLRQSDPNTSYENDAMWVANTAAAGVDEERWGLAEWDLNGLGEIVSAHVEFNPRTRADGDSVQTAFTVDDGIAGETWTSYNVPITGRGAGETPLESLGHITIPAGGPAFGEYIAGADASAGDLAVLNTLRTTTGKFAVALKATVGAMEWNDGANAGGGGLGGSDDAPVRLVIGQEEQHEPLDLDTRYFFTAPSPLGGNSGGSVNTLLEGVFISEFMAVNNSALDDEDGDASDWIEIYNADTTPVDLGGWRLTDDPAHAVAWTLPDGTTLAPGGFLSVFASGKNRAVAGNELHASFRLDGDGEYLALLDTAGVVQHEYTDVPEQFADITYGIQFGPLPDIGAQPGDISITASADTWIRESAADTTYENDLMSVWSSTGDDGARRFGVVEFDVSGLAGQPVSSATLKLYAEANGFSDDFKPIKQTAVSIDTSGGTQAAAMTWTAYQAEYAANVQTLESLGAVDFDPPADGGLEQFVDSAGSAADLTAIQDAANSANGRLTLVMIADEDGNEYAKSWGDQGFTANPAILEVDVGGEPPPARRTPLDPEARFYFETPTPAVSNTRPGVLGFVADTKFSVDRGFFEQNEAFDLSITTATDDADVYFTTNGGEPDPSNPAATRFDPLSPIRIDRTSTIRAAAFVEGLAPTNIDTQTYIFLDDVIAQSPAGQAPPGWPADTVNGQRFDFGMDPDVVNDPEWGPQLKAALESLSTFSIVTELDNLVDPETGLYVNAGGSGRSIERPASIELIHPDGTPGFQIDAGLRPRGNFSASGANPKHAFRLFFRDEYGEQALDYPLFGNEGVDRFRKIDLRTAQNDSWAFMGSDELTFVHDVFARDLQREMDQPYTRSRYHHLYINGVYWGLFQTQERADRYYGQSYFGGDDDDYDVIKSTGGPAYATEATDGNAGAWFDLWSQARNIAVDPNHENYMRIQGLNPDGTRNPAYSVLLDADNLIDYMIGIFYTGDEDRGLSVPLDNNRPNNFFAMRNRNGDRGFAFFAQDAEQSLESFHNRGGLQTDRVGPYSGSNQNNFAYANPQWIHQDLAAIETYRRRFADRVHNYFFNDGLLTPGAVIAGFQSRADEIDLAIIAESARWGDAQVDPRLDKNDWLGALDRLYTQYFPFRGDVVLDQLRGAGLYPELAAPVFNQHGGEITPGFSLTMSDPGSVIYHDSLILPEGVPVRALIPTDDSIGTIWTQPGFADFTGWTDGTTTTGVGYEDTPEEYDALIDTNLNSVPGGGVPGSRPTSVYARIEFDLATSVSPDDLVVLKMKFDDGFVAYLDGEEIARANAPGAVDEPPAFDAAALGSHGEADALDAQEFDVTDAINDGLGGLAAGSHVLAIHGLNVDSTSTDMLILPELAAREVDTTAGAGDIYYTIDGDDPRGDDGQPSPAANLFASAETLNTSSMVKSRILSDGQWSALNEAVFTVNPAIAGNLVVSEIYYNPPQLDSTLDGDEFEFIELLNTSDQAIYLGGVSFAPGDPVDFTFPEGPESNLPAGRTVVIVGNAAAFTSRFPEADNVAGQFVDGKLRNEGEWITLRAASGEIIESFRYNDKSPWPTAADGDGASLQLIAPEHNPDPADPASWTAANPTPDAALPPTVVGRYVFYAGSPLDDGVDGAVATDKTPLLPGENAALENITNYSSGISGVSVDLAQAPGAALLVVGDLTLRVGNDDPATWGPASEATLDVLAGGGRGGSDRLVITWAENAPKNTWLEVTIPGGGGHQTTTTTGLAVDDVFYFGNAAGDTGNSSTDALVNAADVIAIRDNPRGPANPASIDDPYDLNRDRSVDAIDVILARNNATSPLSALRLIMPPILPSTPPLPAAAEARMFDPADEGKSSIAVTSTIDTGASFIESLDGLMAERADQPAIDTMLSFHILGKLQRRLASSIS